MGKNERMIIGIVIGIVNKMATLSKHRTVGVAEQIISCKHEHCQSKPEQ